MEEDEIKVIAWKNYYQIESISNWNDKFKLFAQALQNKKYQHSTTSSEDHFIPNLEPMESITCH